MPAGFEGKRTDINLVNTALIVRALKLLFRQVARIKDIAANYLAFEFFVFGFGVIDGIAVTVHLVDGIYGRHFYAVKSGDCSVAEAVFGIK